MIFFPKPYNIKTYVEGVYNGDTGLYEPGADSEIIIQANAQPVTGRELDSLDIGRNNLGKIKIYTDYELKVAIKGTGQNGDIFIFDDGFEYEVIQKLPYNSNIINHNKYIAEIRIDANLNK